MKRNTSLLALLLLLTSCTIEFSDNGKLDGFWQLRAVDTLENERPDVGFSGPFARNARHKGRDRPLFQLRTSGR